MIPMSENKMQLFEDKRIRTAWTMHMAELSIFERIKRVNEYGSGYWLARELQVALDYKHWRSFLNAIKKAKTACKNSGNAVSDHFAYVRKMVDAGVAPKEIGDIELLFLRRL